MNRWMTFLGCAFLMLVDATIAVLHADDPASSNTIWRIQDNAKVREPIRWHKAEHSGGCVNLEAAIGGHYIYEDAFTKYANVFLDDVEYEPKLRRFSGLEVNRRAGFHVSISEESKADAYRTNFGIKGEIKSNRTTQGTDRRATMFGRIPGYFVQIALWTEVENPDSNERVRVKMYFKPTP